MTVIINPISCHEGVDKVREQLLSLFSQFDCLPHFVETTQTPSAVGLARSAVDAGTELIVVAGGDGTIMQAANALIGTNVPLAIIPLGTGNLMALNLGLPFDIVGAVKVAMTGKVRDLDLVKVNEGEHYFAIMGGVGFDARIMNDTEQDAKKRFGRLAYIWTAIQNLEGDLFNANIKIDDLPTEAHQVKSILMANMGEIGPNFRAFRDVMPDDGYMRVGLLKASTATDFIRLVATTVTEGSPEPDPSFEVFRCRSVDINLDEPQPYEYDGDVEGKITSLHAVVVPHALKILSPSN